jgi:hypothetical protein
MGKCDDPEVYRSLQGLGFYWAQIEAELAKGAKVHNGNVPEGFRC